MLEKLKHIFYKYGVYYSVVFVRGEWIWKPERLLKKSQYYDKGKMAELQLAKINHILTSAKATEFYEGKISLDKIENLNQMVVLPFLEKEDLRESANLMKLKKKPAFCTTKTSGGSTGAPVTIHKPARAMGYELAAAWRGASWAGIDIGFRQARFWGVPMLRGTRRKSMLIDLVTRRIRLSAFKFRNDDLERYLQRLVKKPPDYLYGYTSMIHEFARFLEATNRTDALKPICVITTSEVLTPAVRETIERVFGCKVFNEYGCGEVGTIAHECSYGRMHINAENLYVEIVSAEGKVLGPGEIGEVVVTDLNNDYMPIIRYRLRDFASISYEGCPCGRNLPTLDSLKGRAYDFIVNDIGEKFHGEFFLYIAEELTSQGLKINAIQFIKKVDKLEVLLSIGSEELLVAERYIKRKIADEFSSTILVEVKRVESIPREASGKLRVIKNYEV